MQNDRKVVQRPSGQVVQCEPVTTELGDELTHEVGEALGEALGVGFPCQVQDIGNTLLSGDGLQFVTSSGSRGRASSC